MSTTIRSYTAVKIDNQLAGFVALHIHTPILAEIRSLVVGSQFRHQGLGTKLPIGKIVLEHLVLSSD